MNSRDQSDAIWIRRQQQQQESKYGGPTSKSFSSGGFRGQSSFDLGTTSVNPLSTVNPRFGFSRSMSVNSEGASTASSSNSPPYSPIDLGTSRAGKNGGLNFGGGVGGGGGRFRTSSFSAGYGPSYGGLATDEGSDPYLIHSPLSTSAPGKEGRTFRRSNSISVGALEHSHSGGQTKSKAAGSLGQPPLGPIDEYHKMASFGDAFKRSMDHLFSSPKIQAVNGRFGGSGAGGSPTATPAISMKEKKQNQMKDRVVSMLCESAIR